MLMPTQNTMPTSAIVRAEDVLTSTALTKAITARAQVMKAAMRNAFAGNSIGVLLDLATIGTVYPLCYSGVT